MRLLLDTHILIWMESEPYKLSTRAATLIQDQNNVLFLSLVTIWKIQVKHQIGKLTLNNSLVNIISQQQQTNHLKILPISIDHILNLYSLLLHHRDPVDRLLIAQAYVEGLTIITHDSQFAAYPVSIMW